MIKAHNEYGGAIAEPITLVVLNFNKSLKKIMTIAECLTVRNLHGSMHSMLSEAFMKLSNIQYFLIGTGNSQYMEKIQLLVDFRENPETGIFQPTLLSRCTPRHLY